MASSERLLKIGSERVQKELESQAMPDSPTTMFTALLQKIAIKPPRPAPLHYQNHCLLVRVSRLAVERGKE